MNQAVGDAACFAIGLFVFKRIHQLDGREEPDALSLLLDRVDAKGERQMRFSCSRSADEHNVFDLVDKSAALQVTEHGFINPATSKIEAGEILIDREPSRLDLIGNRADLALSHLSLKQLRENGRCRFKSGCALFG